MLHREASSVNQPFKDALEVIGVIRHDFASNPGYWDRLWQEFSADYPGESQLLSLHGRQLQLSNVEVKFAFLQGVLFSYAIGEKHHTATELSQLVEYNEQTPTIDAPEELYLSLGFLAFQPTIPSPDVS